jgi:hypothetical protein
LKLKVLRWRWEILCVLAYLLLTGSQLFMQPIIGLADNGDFPKVLSPLDVCDPDNEHDVFAYVYPAYILDARCHWDSQMVSSETLFVRALKIVTRWRGRRGFRITAAGTVHLAVELAALMILLWALHDVSRPLRFGLPPLAIFIFSDIAYVAYLNSFYMDTAALVFLLLTVAAAGAWVLRPRAWVAIAFGIAGTLLGFAKSQHALTAYFFAVLAGWFAAQAFLRREHNEAGLASPSLGREGVGFRPGANCRAWCWVASAASLALAATVSILATPADLKAQALYNLIFFRFVPESPAQVTTLSEFKLPESDLVYSGTNSYSQGTAMGNDAWRAEFTRKVTLTMLVTYYLQHPSIPLEQSELGLTESASGIRPNLGNYQRDAGFPPFTRARRVDSWSDVRAWLLRVFPFHVVIFYVVMGIGSLLCLFRRSWAARWPLSPLVLLLAVSGIVEFLSSVLLDVIETSRHLFLFHVITELLIICAFAAILCMFRPNPRHLILNS